MPIMLVDRAAATHYPLWPMELPGRIMTQKPTSKAVFAEVKKLEEEEESLKCRLETQGLLILSHEEEHQRALKCFADDQMTLKKQKTDMEERLAAVQASKLELERLALDLQRKGQ